MSKVYKSPKKVQSGKGRPMTASVKQTTLEYEQTLAVQEHSRQIEVSTKEIEIERLASTIDVLNAKVAVTDDHEQAHAYKHTKFEESDAGRVQLQQHVIVCTKELEVDTNKHNQYQKQLEGQITSLQQQLEKQKVDQHNSEQSLKSQMEQVRVDLTNQRDQVRQQLTTQLEQVRRDLTNERETVRKNLTANLEQVRTDLTNQRDQVRKDLTAQMQQVRKDLTAQREQIRIDLTAQLEQLRRDKDAKIQSLEAAMEQQRVSMTATIDSMTIKINNLTTELHMKTSIILKLTEQLEIKKDVESQLSAANAHISVLEGQRIPELQNALNEASDKMILLEEKVYKSQRTSLELLKQLKDAEIEIETLKQYIIDLKQRIAVYIPVKEDSIDKKLAEYINNYPERSKLKIMFMRETEGVYQFGTKKVAVKVEKNNIKIRVGGGYLSIDEFLDQYTPVELEKLERNDPLKRFSEKVAIQKTLVTQGVRESSPVARASPSPKKKSKY